jgi:hypothetical protein
LRAFFSHLFSWSERAEPATVVVGTKDEGAPLASVRLIGLVSTSHYGGEHER